MQNSMDRKWIIKSDNKILGPYSFDQIEDLLKKKQISIIDEVRDMNNRWLYIRESPELQSIVEEIRLRLSKNDDHTRTVQTRHSFTGTASKTQEISEFTTTNTPPKTFTNVSVAEAQDISFSEEITFKQKEPVAKSILTQQYAHRSDSMTQVELKQSSNHIKIGLVAIFIILAGGGYLTYHFKKKDKQQQEMAMLGQLRKYYLFGLENKFIDLFGRINADQQIQILPQVIPMWPKLDQAGLIQIKEQVLRIRAKTNLSLEQKAQLELVDFNNAMLLKDLKKSREAIIKARDVDPANEVAKENDAILFNLEELYKNSSDLFLQLYKVNPKGRFLFGYAINELKLNRNNDQYIIDEIKKYTQKNYDFKKELLLIGLVISKKLKLEDSYKNLYSDFINFPIKFKDHFFVSYSVANSFYDGQQMISIFNLLPNDLTFSEKSEIEIHVRLENSEPVSAEKVYKNTQSSFAQNSKKINTQILIDSSLKNYEKVLISEKLIVSDQLNLAAQTSLLDVKIKSAQSESEFSPQVSYFKKQGSFWTTWVTLLTEKNKNKEMLYMQSNDSSVSDLKVFLEAKGADYE